MAGRSSRAGGGADSAPTRYHIDDFSYGGLSSMCRAAGTPFSKKDFLRQHGLCAPDGRLTLAGLLLADDSPVPASRIDCHRFCGLLANGRTGVECEAVSGLAGSYMSSDSEEIAGSLPALLGGAMHFVRRNMRILTKVVSGAPMELPDYRECDVFEILLNALVHRDYACGEHQTTRLEMYDDRLMIDSPGRTLSRGGRRTDGRKNGRACHRNPLLVSVFTSLGCMHGEGLGIAGIMQRHEEYSLPKGQTPVFWDGISRFRVVLPNLNWRKTTTDRVNRVRADLMKKMLAQSELDQEKGAWVGMLWDRWGRGEYFSAAETAEMLDISVPTARGLLKDLEQAGLIESCSGYVRGAYRFL